ncbi:uncharacterized protein LOC110807562 [Carica papaya]|uniref:uncharacterized protein LOC110807562 n=1 Tax=Carica papaya TaxID=3649 RepID=UPI000B8C7BD7|nr:uncharacterized protein LOC110807562 [Carica papaya]
MTTEIGENFLLYETAHDVWVAAGEFYSSRDNTLAIFKIETHLHDLRQGELTMTQYYNALTRNWQQLNVFEEHQWNYPEDSKLFKTLTERKRIFKFLMGLNKNLDEVCGRILGTKPLPSLKEVFSEIHREESRKKIMMRDPYSGPNSMETSFALDAQWKSLLSESQLATLKPEQTSALIGRVSER